MTSQEIIAELQEEACVSMVETWTYSGEKIFLDYESFAAKFAGQEVERNEYVLTKTVDDCQYMASLRGKEVLSGPYVMPALETAKGGA